jgi:hypothetical protein
MDTKEQVTKEEESLPLFQVRQHGIERRIEERGASRTVEVRAINEAAAVAKAAALSDDDWDDEIDVDEREHRVDETVEHDFSGPININDVRLIEEGEVAEGQEA